jgi:hypothetical protein
MVAGIHSQTLDLCLTGSSGLSPGAGDAGTFTVVFVSDRFTQGQALYTGLGDGWDGGAVALIYNHPNLWGLTLLSAVMCSLHPSVGVLAIAPEGTPQPFDIDLERSNPLGRLA